MPISSSSSSTSAASPISSPSTAVSPASSTVPAVRFYDITASLAAQFPSPPKPRLRLIDDFATPLDHASPEHLTPDPPNGLDPDRSAGLPDCAPARLSRREPKTLRASLRRTALRTSRGSSGAVAGAPTSSGDSPPLRSAARGNMDEAGPSLDSGAANDSTSAALHSNVLARHSSPTASDHTVHPAAIPTRTSSATHKGSPKKPKSTHSGAGDRARRYSSKLAEVDEDKWLARGMEGMEPEARGLLSSNSHILAQQVASRHSQPLSTDLVDGNASGWTPEKENILKGPFEYMESHPGKDIRSQLITAFNAWLQVPPDSLAIITRVVGMLHTASLLMDDVEDDSNLRRGVPVAHAIFGTAQTLNSANYIYFCALQELLKLNNPEVIRIYTEELLNLHRGQGMDLFWRDTLTCPSEDDYLEMVGNKTGGLFRLAIKLMCAESPSHHGRQSLSDPHGVFTNSNTPSPAHATDYIPLVNTIGLLFQILDDYLNLSSHTYTTNKGLCEDLTEGKFSFPIIHAIRSDPQDLVLINILKQKTRDDDVKRYAVALMERGGSFAYTRRVLRGLHKKAQDLFEEVDGGRGKAEGIRVILDKLKVERMTGAGGARESIVRPAQGQT